VPIFSVLITICGAVLYYLHTKGWNPKIYFTKTDDENADKVSYFNRDNSYKLRPGFASSNDIHNFGILSSGYDEEP
jgi:hypothetical protein